MWESGPNLSGKRVRQENTVFSGQKKGALRAPF